MLKHRDHAMTNNVATAFTRSTLRDVNSTRYGKTDIEAKSPEAVPGDIEAA
jgi:hypothetical protein